MVWKVLSCILLHGGIFVYFFILFDAVSSFFDMVISVVNGKQAFMFLFGYDRNTCNKNGNEYLRTD